MATTETGGASESERFISDFQQLVKRGAAITYCTTSAGDLAQLAEGSQSFDWTFDWSIVEEAGKAHGFDLALPLQAGHRWLLIGDDNQLPPYRYKDYEKGIKALDEAVEALNRLPDRSLLDKNWIDDWGKQTEEDKKEFTDYAQDRLKTFGCLFSSLKSIHGEEHLTQTETIGAKAGMLVVQYRMHPAIGDLISETFYKGEVDNGKPESELSHPFKLRVDDENVQLNNKAIVWIDVPWCQHDLSCEEIGPAKGKPRYTNEIEVKAVKGFLRQLDCPQLPKKPLKVAVLSPYNQQVRRIKKQLQQCTLPKGLELLESLRVSRIKRRNDWAHTVDSFQGNQADVIIVSLVRNNTNIGDKGLGFLQDSERLNVLLSRAERLLVLVGSWEFFDQQLTHIDLEDENHPLWRWKKILDTLEKRFADGKAVKIPYQQIIADGEK